MTTETLTLTEMENGEWRIEQVQEWTRNGSAITSVQVPRSQVHVNSAYSGIYRVTVPDVIHMERFSKRSARALWEGDRPIAPKGDATEDVDGIDRIELGESSSDVSFTLRDLGGIAHQYTTNSDEDGVSSSGIAPIVAESDNVEQRTAAQLDRRPLVRVTDRSKYTTVVVSLSPTGLQLSPTALRELGMMCASTCADANASGEQKADVYVNVTSGRFEEPPSLHRQTLVIDDLMIEYANPLVAEIAEYLRTTPGAFCRYTDSQPDVRDSIIDGRTIPRPAAGEPVVVKEVHGTGRHAPLSDTVPNDDAVTAYTSPEAKRIARHIQEHVGVSIDRENGVIVGEDTLNGYTATVEFDAGDPVDHVCDCPTDMDTCEHVAAVLNDLPQFTIVYTADSP